MLSGSPRGREFPSTSKSRPEPVVVAVQQLVEDPSDVFRVEVPRVALAPQRLLYAARRCGSRRQPPRLSPRAPVPAPQPSRRTRPCGETGPQRSAEEGRGLGPPSPAPPGCGGARGRLWGPVGLGAGGSRGGAAHSPHSDACPGDEQSHASGTCEDVVRCPQTRQLEQASVLILPFPLGQGLRRVRRSESPAGSPPSPWSSAALCPRWGGGGCLWPCVSFGFATAVQPHPTVPGEELGFEGTVRGRRAVTIIE